MQLLKSTGIIKYDPYRGSMKKRTSWWCICEIDKEITRYYRYWIFKKYGIEVFRPAWDAHISIIRGEVPKDKLKNKWYKYDREEVEFEYSSKVDIQKNGKFFTIDVHCEKFKHIRDELGFYSKYVQHITVGRLYMR